MGGRSVGRAQTCLLEACGFQGAWDRGQSRGLCTGESGIHLGDYAVLSPAGAWGGELEGHKSPPRQDLGAQKSRFPVNVLFAPLFPLLQKAFFPAVTWGARTIPPFLPPPPLPGPPVLSLHSSHLRLDGHRASSPGHGSLTIVVSLWACPCPGASSLSLVGVGTVSVTGSLHASLWLLVSALHSA